jgi:hypothetical protein
MATDLSGSKGTSKWSRQGQIFTRLTLPFFERPAKLSNRDDFTQTLRWENPDFAYSRLRGYRSPHLEVAFHLIIPCGNQHRRVRNG